MAKGAPIWIAVAEPEPFTLLPGQAVDLTLYGAWAGELYAVVRAGVYRYAIQLE